MPLTPPAVLLAEAHRELVRSVDAMPEPAYREASLLPGWTRGHVVAHLALGGEGLTRVLVGARVGEPAPMYDSPEKRDSDIQELAEAGPAALRARLLASTTGLGEALEALPDDRRDERFERTPGVGLGASVGRIDVVRLREVEIHHVDLAVGRTRADWTPEFGRLLVESFAAGHAPAPACVVHAVDLDQRWAMGAAREQQDGALPVVSGTAADLGWWLAGRGDGEGLTADAGALPVVGAW